MNKRKVKGIFGVVADRLDDQFISRCVRCQEVFGIPGGKRPNISGRLDCLDIFLIESPPGEQVKIRKV